MAISHEEVRSIAELAKLELTDEEVTVYADQLTAILDSFERLRAVDTSGVDSIASVLPIDNVLRVDKVQTPLTPEEAITNAPESEDNQFRVHAVLEE